MTTTSFRLPTLLQDWRLKLTSWADDGSLGAAARAALGLDGEPAQLTALISQWAAGDFSGLPPIEVVQASVLPGAAGAYAISTGTIYLNADWLRFASGTQVLDVLNEELGHYLDGLMNPSDTPGDEGAIFAALVRAEGLSPMAMAGLKTENDQGWLEMDDLKIGAEFSNPTISLILTSPTTVTEDGPQNLFYVFSRTGDTTNSLTVNFTVAGNATFNSDYGQRGATSFDATTGSVTFAAGSSVVILSLDPSSDLVSDGDETVALSLAAGTGYAVGTTGAVTGTILDNDAAPGTVVGGSIARSQWLNDNSKRQEVDNRWAFAALKSDGSVVTWGNSESGGDSSSVSSRLTSGVTQIFSTYLAFAALKSDGSVVTWGSSEYTWVNSSWSSIPIDSSNVNSRLTSSVTQIFSTNYAFAALKSDGSVVTWGLSNYGGDSSVYRYNRLTYQYEYVSSVSSRLTSGVTQIFSNGMAFAALKSDGSVVTWGLSDFGGNSSSVSSSLTSGVAQIFSNEMAFAALKSDGSVITWGSSDWGSPPTPIESSSVSSSLASGVTQIFTAEWAFAALKSDGSVVTWGNSGGGGDSSSVSSRLTSGVTQIFSTGSAFAALKSDGSVVTWGSSWGGGNSSSVSSSLTSGVTQIFSTGSAFAALKSDGSVVTWGSSEPFNSSWIPIDSSSVSSSLTSGVTQIYSNEGAFAALKSDGSVVTWGASESGGNSSSVSSRLTSGVTQIFSTCSSGAFAALKSDGSVVTWGSSGGGGDSSSVSSRLTSGVTQIFSNGWAFAALKSDGSVVTWGSSDGGGDSSSVSSQLTSAVVSFADPFNDDRLVHPQPTPVTLALAPASATEDGTTNLVYTFTRNGFTGNALTVSYFIGGSAINGNDYSSIGSSVTFAAGSSTATVTVDPIADNNFEADETVILSLASGTGYIIGTTTPVTGTIVNDDASVSLAVSPSTVTEDGATNLLYTFTRTGAISNALSVNYTVSGTATFNSDYSQTGATTFTTSTGTVTFAAGASTATLSLDPSIDSLLEADETISLTLLPGTGYSVDTSAAVNATILNNDAPTNLALGGQAILPGQPLGTVIAELESSDPDSGNTFTYSLVAGVGDSDNSAFQIVGNQLRSNAVFNAVSRNSYSIRLRTTDQGGLSYEQPVTITVAAAALPTQIVTTLRDVSSASDGLTSLREAITQAHAAGTDGTILLGEGRFSLASADDFDIQLTGRTLTIQGLGADRTILDGNNLDRLFEVQAGASLLLAGVTLTGGKAAQGGAIANNGSLTIGDSVIHTNQAQGLDGVNGPAGSNGIANDGNPIAGGPGGSGSSGTAASGGAISNTGSLTLVNTTIRDNQAIGGRGGSGGSGGSGSWAGLSGAPFIGGRGGNGGNGGNGGTALGGGVYNTGQLTLTNVNVGSHGVTAGTAGSAGSSGPGGRNATTGYASSGSPGNTGAGGSAWGPFIYNLNSGSISSTTALQGIFNAGGSVIAPDWAIISVAAFPSNVAEDGSTNLIYTFTRTGSSIKPLVVNYTIAGTAIPQSDYTGIVDSGSIKTVSFAAGSTTATVTITPTADIIVEDDETVIVSLAAGEDYSFGSSAAATATIRNDDLPVITFAVSPAAVAEDGTSNLIYTFTRTGPTTGALTVNYGISGTTDATDYTGATAGTGKTITFTSGSATATLTIDPTADTTIEADETVALTLAAGSGYTIGTTGAVGSTIINDDFPAITLALSPASIPEADNASLVYTFTRPGLNSSPLTVNFTVSGSASLGLDYNQAGASAFSTSTGQVTFAAGASTTVITLTASADNLVEPDETITLKLAAGTGYAIGTTDPVVGTFTSLPGQLIRTPISATSPGSTHQEVRHGSAFAALKSDGSVVTWGDPANGGNSSSVAGQLGGAVSQITSNYWAFAALKGDGSVVTWGDSRYGGSSSSVASQLSSGVTRIASTASAFAALKSNGSVISWGNSNAGGNSSSVASLLSSGVSKIFATEYAFAALKADGSVVTWGSSSNGGDSSAVAGQLSSGVTQIFANDYAFAALKADGSVVTWGGSSYGGNSSALSSLLSSGVSQIFSTNGAFAALKSNGSVVTWGRSDQGGDSSGVASQLSSGVSQVFASNSAFAALKRDGSVITWGPIEFGGNSNPVSALLSSGVSQIFASGSAFAALKTNGSVVTWGSFSNGGNSSGVASQLASGVSRIVSTLGAFAAIKSDGSLVNWGNAAYGGNNAGVASQLTAGVRDVFSNEAAFAAVKNDGSVVTWGQASSGGDSSAVAPQLRSGVVSFADPFHDDRLLAPAGEPRITVALTPGSVTEDGSANLVYTFSRTGPTTSALSVNYSVSGTASLGTDYSGIVATAVTKTVGFAAGAATASVTVDPSADAEIEPDETIALSLAPGSGYSIGTTAAVVGTILNDDTALENEGNTALLRGGDGQPYAGVGSANKPITFMGSPASPGNASSSWQMLAAERIGTANKILWRYNPTGQVHVWALDSNWAWTGADTGLVDPNSSAGWELESSFQLDLNADSIIGAPLTPIESQGNTNLVRHNSSGQPYASVGSTITPITFMGSPASPGNASSSWQMLAAETIGTANKILWRYNPTGQVHVWALDSNWAWTGADTGLVDPNSSAGWELESSFQLDLNADAIIGTPFTAIESQGNTSLVRHNGSGQPYASAGSSATAISFMGSPASAGSASSTWQMLAAETIGTANKILWRYNPTGQLHVWALDSNWAWTGADTGLVDTNSSAGWELEASFQLDLNADSIIGTPFTAIESQGNTSLVRHHSTGQPYASVGSTITPITFMGSPASPGNASSTWQMLAAESGEIGNKILWRYNPTGQLHVWALDSNWAWTGADTGLVDTNSNTGWGLESSFQLDLNGDSIIGTPFTEIEWQGNTSLVRHNSTGQPYASAGSTITPITFMGSPASPGNASSTWQMLAAETIGTANKILWRYNPTGQLHMWALDSNWAWTGADTGLVDRNSSAGSNLVAQFGYGIV